MTYDAVIVGGGASGLTAAAYMARAGLDVLLLEKEGQCGGLVNSFERAGFTFDGGIRALENAGVLFTMLKQLGLELECVRNRISIGIEDQYLEVESDHSLDEYGNLLIHLYPGSKDEITAIINDLRLIMHYMDIQYGIENPLFLDPKKDRDYFLKRVLPWMFKYAFTVRKVMAKNRPVIPYLRDFTTNQALLDIITQHFFRETPAYFALSYLKIFQDYHYPKTGTGTFAQLISDYILKHGGRIKTGTRIKNIDLQKNTAFSTDGDAYNYRYLLWAADQKRLYESIKGYSRADRKITDSVEKRKKLISEMSGNDSVFTLYLSVDLDKSYFEKRSTGHFFYTPSRKGLSTAGDPPLAGTKNDLLAWLKMFFELTSYEISIPVLRESTLAPAGKTGLIISMLFDYGLTRIIHEQGWGDEFRQKCTQFIIRALDDSVYPGLADAIIDSFTSTPLTLQQVAGTTDGAITGWAFTNHPMPAENRLTRISKSVTTPIPNIFQAGQWTYSPAGFPVSLITGKIAADRIIRAIGKS